MKTIPLANLDDQTSFRKTWPLWCQWLLLLVFVAFFNSCKDGSFTGSGKNPVKKAGGETTAGGPNGPNGLNNGLPGTDNNGGPNASNAPGIDGSDGSANPNGPGIDEENGSSTIPRVPMKITYNAEESGSGGYTGPFEFSAKRGADPEFPLVSFAGGAKKTVISVPNVCTCGKKNEFDLIISAGGEKKNLAAWQAKAGVTEGVVMTSRSHPSNASDWEDYIEHLKDKPQGKNAVYLGGFDHTFLFGDDCGSFACDSRKWNNRDDVMMVFTCEVESCPKKDENFELSFIGLEP